jgi:hypothetical protein
MSNAEKRSEALQGADDGTGCCFPGRCCMPGEHLRSECHTAEMMEEYLAEQGADQRSSLAPRGRQRTFGDE